MVLIHAHPLRGPVNDLELSSQKQTLCGRHLVRELKLVFIHTTVREGVLLSVRSTFG